MAKSFPTSGVHQTPRGILRRFLPITTGFLHYFCSDPRAALIAGLAIWALTMLQALAYAGIAGMPPVARLYADL